MELFEMIREAEPADKDAIQSLYKALCPDAPVYVLPERITELKQDPHNYLFVHENEGTISGTVFLTICPSPMFGFQPFGLIEYFIVDEKYRGQGIGNQLTDHVIQVCRDKKCTRIVLISNDHRKAAHALYESKGFSSSGKVGFVKYLNRK
jgi:GNAT superfamily N-acetyltransferase